MSVSEDYINIAEYGNWVYGYLPSGEITAIILYNDQFIDSYIEWHTRYDDTPLKSAFESYVGDTEMHISECSYWNPELEKEFEHGEGQLVSALRGIPQTSKKYKNGFKKKVSDKEVEFPCPVIVNRYGDIYAHEDYTDEVREIFMNHVKEQHGN